MANYHHENQTQQDYSDFTSTVSASISSIHPNKKYGHSLSRPCGKYGLAHTIPKWCHEFESCVVTVEGITTHNACTTPEPLQDPCPEEDTIPS